MYRLKNIFIISIVLWGIQACDYPGKTTKNNIKNDSLEAVVDSALNFAESQCLLMAKKYEDKEGELPRTFENGKDVSSDSRWWCSGFFPGCLWYLYENSNNQELKKYAQFYTSRIEREKYTTDNHDVGFMLYCSFGNGYRITKDSHYKEVLLTGARSLSTRYNPKIGVIRSWDWNREKWQFPVIIDNIMNLELLLWASENSDETRFKDIALSHANKTMEYHFRSDYSSYHVVSYDTITGKPHIRQTHQGFSDESAWSRGQAWGLYGYIYLYRETKDNRYLQQAVHIANFIINHPNMPKDYIPHWDFNASDIPNAPRDVSAASVIASALVQLSDFVDKELSDKFMNIVETQIRNLACDKYTAQLGENGCFILKHSVGSFPHHSEVDVPLSYADYYYLETLVHLRRKHKIKEE